MYCIMSFKLLGMCHDTFFFYVVAPPPPPPGPKTDKSENKVKKERYKCTVLIY